MSAGLLGLGTSLFMNLKLNKMMKYYSELRPFLICTSVRKEVEIKHEKVKKTCPQCEPVGNNRSGVFCSKCGAKNVEINDIKTHKKVELSPSIAEASTILEEMGEKLIFPARGMYEYFEDYGQMIFESQMESLNLTNREDEEPSITVITPEMVSQAIEEFKQNYTKEIKAMAELFGWSNVEVKFGLIHNWS